MSNHVMSVPDEFEKAGYSGELLDSMRRAWASHPTATKQDIIDLATLCSTQTFNKLSANTIVYPGQSSQTPKRKPKQRKKLKPKNRTVYRK